MKTNTDFLRALHEAAHRTPLPVSLEIHPVARPRKLQWAEAYGGHLVWVFSQRVVIPTPTRVLDLRLPDDAAAFDRDYIIKR